MVSTSKFKLRHWLMVAVLATILFCVFTYLLGIVLVWWFFSFLP